jgi:hypothetical protein
MSYSDERVFSVFVVPYPVNVVNFYAETVTKICQTTHYYILSLN